MTAKIEGNELVIRIAVNNPLVPSKSGKSKILATTNGNVKFTDLVIDGKPVTLGINAYISAN